LLPFILLTTSFAQHRIIVIDDSRQKSLQNISVLIDGSPPVEFIDDGVSPDKIANDSIHTAKVNIVKDTARMQFNSRGEKLNELNLTINQEENLGFVAQNNIISIASTSSIKLFEFKVGKTPTEIELQARQSPDSIIANITVVNQGSALKSLRVSLDGELYSLRDDGQEPDKVKGDNTWSVQIQAKKQEKLQLYFDNTEDWKDNIAINCSDKNEQNIQIIRMLDNFLLYGNEELPNQNQPQENPQQADPANSETQNNASPINEESQPTSNDPMFNEIPDSNKGDIYLIAILISGLCIAFFAQIYIRWKGEVQPVLQQLTIYLEHRGYSIVQKPPSENDVSKQEDVLENQDEQEVEQQAEMENTKASAPLEKE
jgi:hypothetical protein